MSENMVPALTAVLAVSDHGVRVPTQKGAPSIGAPACFACFGFACDRGCNERQRRTEDHFGGGWNEIGIAR